MKLFRLRSGHPAADRTLLRGLAPGGHWTVQPVPPLPDVRMHRSCSEGHERVEWTGLPGCWYCGKPGGAA